MRKIGIIDYGQGNINSVSKALKKLGADYIVSNNLGELNLCSHLILPGVGAFPTAMKKLDKLELSNFLREFASTKPILGICLGAQLLFESSTELGITKGLGIIKGKVRSFDSRQVDKVMNVGWRKVIQSDSSREGYFTNNIRDKEFYFVHKYYIHCDDKNAISYMSTNSNFEFVSAVEKSRIIACQFHPEKSRTQGLEVILKFMNI
jgi:imidazole glycerol-phosphate synthase subunit HisH